MKNIMIMTTSYKLILVGVIGGAIVGYLYYHYVGCLPGSCGITSSPVNSSIYGAMMGGSLLSMFKKERAESDQNPNEKHGHS